MRDLRRYAQQTNMRLLAGFVILLFGVGLGLIYVFFGAGAALLGAVCMLAGLAPLLLIGLSLWFIEWLVKRSSE